MNYTLNIQRRVQKQLAKLPSNIYELVRDSIRNLSTEPRPLGCLKLTNRSAWRIRVKNYRVIYEIDDQKQTILIVDIGHRRDIYSDNN